MKPKLRSVNTKFWQDTYITDLDPIEKLLFLYLLTNPLCNIAGVYEISLRQIAFDTGIDKDMVQKIFNRFEADNKIIYKNNYIILLNFIKNQSYNDSMKKGAMNILGSLPQDIQKLAKERENSNLDRLSQSDDTMRQIEDEDEREYEVEKEDEREDLPPPPDFSSIKNEWNKLAESKKLNTIKSIDRKRKDKLKVRFSEEEFNLKEIFKIISKSPFLLGVNERGWKVSFDWIIGNSNNYLKILEGKYMDMKINEFSLNTIWRFVPTGKDSQLIEYNPETEKGKMKHLGTGAVFDITKYELQRDYKHINPS